MKIKVPEGMLEAAIQAVRNYRREYPQPWEGELKAGMEAALAWWREHPIVPDPAQSNEIWRRCAQRYSHLDNGEIAAACIAEWQHILFLDSEPEIPKEKEQIVRSLAFLKDNTEGEIRAAVEVVSSRSGLDELVERVRSKKVPKPEPELPEEIRDLLWRGKKVNGLVSDSPEMLQEQHDKWVLEAYHRGQLSRNNSVVGQMSNS